jgi:hypothetical protein
MIVAAVALLATLAAWRCWALAAYMRELRRGQRLAAAHWAWVVARYRVERDGRDARNYAPGRYDDNQPTRQRREAA